MYKPLTFFAILGAIPFAIGLILGIRFLIAFITDHSSGHIQSLILASTLMMIGFMTWVVGILSDTIASERKILEDTQYHARRTDYAVEELKNMLENDREAIKKQEKPAEAAKPIRTKSDGGTQKL
jgi:hypothetical protein